MNAITRNRERAVFWFSCGDASAVNTKLGIAEYGATHDIRVCRCIVPEEHPDNDRFASDCEKWFGQEIINLRSKDYASCEDVWTRERYMSGVGGARCTVEMKKAVRWDFEREWQPDIQGFGYTSDETGRVERFRAQNPDVNVVSLLVKNGLDKEACHAIVRRAGLISSEMYRLGFPNANCIGCVNAQSPRYWNRTRRLFPEVFAARATLSRELGARLVKLTSGDRERVYLDELDPALDEGDEGPAAECSLLCYSAEQLITAAPAALKVHP
jgi:hypothetical protein